MYTIKIRACYIDLKTIIVATLLLVARFFVPLRFAFSDLKITKIHIAELVLIYIYIFKH